MKRIISLSAMAAVLLCGCSDSGEISASSFSFVSQSSSSIDPAMSSLLEGLEISLPEGGVSEYSHSSSIAKATINKKRTVPAEKTYVVYNNTQLFIKDGGELTVDGKFDADNTGKITIEKGGALILNGESALNCELTIEDGGKLVVGENKTLSGNGKIIVLGGEECFTNLGVIDKGIEIKKGN